MGWGVRGGETGKASYSIWVFSCWNGKAGKQNGLIGLTFLKCQFSPLAAAED